MENYYKEYKKVKGSLCAMITQYLTCFISVDDVNKLNLNIDNDTFRYGKYVEVCSHNDTKDGLEAWKYLDIDEEVISHDDMWLLEDKVYEEEIDNSKDYYKECLEMKILLINLVLNYCSKKISIEDAVSSKIIFISEDDIINNEVIVCDHEFMSAGERAWEILGIDKCFILPSRLRMIKNDYVNLLNDLDSKKLIKTKYE